MGRSVSAPPRHRASHSLIRASVLLGSLAAGAPAGAQPAVQRALASIAPIVIRDGSGRVLAKGAGFFTEIGRLIVQRRLLDGARQATVVYAGSERRVTAVLAEDRSAEFVMLAVDLPDGAPPPLHPVPTVPSAVRTPAVVLDLDSPPQPVEIEAPVDMPVIGSVRRVAGGTAGLSNGSAVVDANGELLGALSVSGAGDDRLAYVVPAGRLASMAGTAPMTLPEWAAQAGPRRPVESDRLFLQGIHAALDGSPGQAVDAFTGAARLNPGDAEAWAAIAFCERALGRHEPAIAAWRDAVAAQPSHPRYHHELAVELADGGHLDEAAREFAEVVSLRPADAAARFNLGTIYGQLHRYQDEYTEYQAALSVEPANVVALRNLGIACVQLGRYQEAVSAYGRARQLTPNNPEIYTGLGVSYFHLKDYPAAIAAMRQAVALAPSFPQAHFGLGMVLVASGDMSGARAECKTLKTLDKAQAETLCRMAEDSPVRK